MSLILAGCAPPEGLGPAAASDTVVRFEVGAPLPFPNDLSTRYDPGSPTGRRLNLPIIAPTVFERRLRARMNTLDGFGVFASITIPFSGPIDSEALFDRHNNTDASDDAIYLINIDPSSPEFGRQHLLDLGHGNYPPTLEQRDRYGDADTRASALSVGFEEIAEDLNGNGLSDPGEDRNRNGVLDPGEDLDQDGMLDPPEDTDADGVLDHPNHRTGARPDPTDLAARADALMTFYERESRTVITTPMTPLRERTRYAVVVTRRLLDENSAPVGSPFAFINHASQTDQLQPLVDVLPAGLALDSVALAWSFTTGSMTSDWVAIRQGLYGEGPQAGLATDFPPELTRLFPLRDAESGDPFADRTPWIAHAEDVGSVLERLRAFTHPELDATTLESTAIVGSESYVDFHAMGSYSSPQFFERLGVASTALSLDDQVWKTTLDATASQPRAEEIPFWLVVPRKEISARGRGRPIDLVVLSPSYRGDRASAVTTLAGFLASAGFAVIVPDPVSHHLTLLPEQWSELDQVAQPLGLAPLVDALRFNRNSPDPQSGGDFWTGYLFHTRDMVRQSVVDLMQLIRVIRAWDGHTTWNYDANNNGIADDDLAGDFDGDGQLDIGRDSAIYAAGAGQGAILATLAGALEPHVDAVIALAPGGRLSDVGFRSHHQGIPQAVAMRLMGPVYVATLNDDGLALVHTQVPESNRLVDIPLRLITPPTVPLGNGLYGDDPLLLPGDTMVVRNLVNGRVGCAALLPSEEPGVSAQARVSVASDKGDPTEIRFYRGPALVVGSGQCQLVDDAQQVLAITRTQPPVDAQGIPIEFDGEVLGPGRLRALADGLGLQRGSPQLRRFSEFAQTILDPADPATFARHLNHEPLEYPALQQQTGARFLFVHAVGDMDMPTGAGITLGRAAGIIGYDRGSSPSSNDRLLETFTTEGVHDLRRFVYPDPPQDQIDRELVGLDITAGIHMDVDDLSRGADPWGSAVPRLEPPLRLFRQRDIWGNQLPGGSGMIFPYVRPSGGPLVRPGRTATDALRRCQRTYGPEDSQCAPQDVAAATFDVGWATFHAIVSFLRADGTDPVQAGCSTRHACNRIAMPPSRRSADTLP